MVEEAYGPKPVGYNVIKRPNYSRMSKYGTTQEDAYRAILDYGGAVENNVDYFPKYDIYSWISVSIYSWMMPTIEFYAKTEKEYQRFRKEVIVPALDELWRNR